MYDKEAADAFDIDMGTITVMIHCGSRGFGHQICDDYAKGMVRSLSKYNINVPDRQLAYLPLGTQTSLASSRRLLSLKNVLNCSFVSAFSVAEL